MRVLKKRRILVIAPHPDDEVLGCGGTIAKYVRGGASVALCVVTKAYEPQWSAAFVRNRPQEVQRASKILGIEKVFFLDFPTVKLDSIPQKELNDALLKIVSAVKPDTLFIPHRGDINRDHQLVHAAGLVAARPCHSTVTKILSYETLSETEWGVEPFVPTVYEDISKTLDAKCAALAAYKSEVKKFPHPRSLKALEALAAKRGSEAGLMCAEAFMLVREIR